MQACHNEVGLTGMDFFTVTRSVLLTVQSPHSRIFVTPTNDSKIFFYGNTYKTHRSIPPSWWARWRATSSSSCSSAGDCLPPPASPPSLVWRCCRCRSATASLNRTGFARIAGGTGSRRVAPAPRIEVSISASSDYTSASGVRVSASGAHKLLCCRVVLGTGRTRPSIAHNDQRDRYSWGSRVSLSPLQGRLYSRHIVRTVL